MASLPLPSPKPHPSDPNSFKTKKPPQFSDTQFPKPSPHIKSSSKISHKSYLHQISSLCKDGLLKQAFTLLAQMQSADIPVGPELYGELLQGCLSERALSQGQQIHARILKLGTFYHKNEYIETKLLIFYAKCDCWEIAEDLFLRQCRPPNVFSWAAMIGLQCRRGLNEKALVGFCNMMVAGLVVDNFIIPNALKACSAMQLISFGRAVHGYALKKGFGCCVYVQSSLVDFYGKCGVLEDARTLFDGMADRNVVTWNSMLVGLVQNGMNEEALDMFCHMRTEGVDPTRVSIASFLSASANLEAFHEGRQGHAVAVLNGLELDNILGTSLINFYSKVGMIDDAEIIFRLTGNKDVVTWNLLISGYVRDRRIEKALDTCHQMRKEHYQFDSVTLASIISACADFCMIELGKAGHCFCIRNNLESDVVIASSLVDLYGACGRVEHARRVFDATIPRDLVLWNTLIAAYARNGLSRQALKLLYQMQLEGMPPNVASWNSIIMSFLQNGEVNEAQNMYSQMQLTGVRPNLITWSMLICGLAQNGYSFEAIHLFGQIQAVGLNPSPTSIVGLLLACTNIPSLRFGRIVHGQVMRRGLLTSPPVATSLIDMYCKCGSINLAKKLFEMLSCKELPLYNAMISGYALHGQAKEAMTLFRNMYQLGIMPDDITFTGLLSTCSHAGLVDDALKIFSDMVSIYHLTPKLEHYGCVVNLLALCGRVEEALRLITTMPFEPDAHILGSLLASCRENHEIELSEYLSGCLIKLEPENTVNSVTLSNVYAASERWHEASNVRTSMKDRGLEKNPGCSWIQIGSELHTFVADDRSHPQIHIIFETLLCLHNQMKDSGCAP